MNKLGTIACKGDVQWTSDFPAAAPKDSIEVHSVEVHSVSFQYRDRIAGCPNCSVLAIQTAVQSQHRWPVRCHLHC